MSHIIKCSIEDGVIAKIDYDTNHPSQPKPGKHVKAPPHGKVRLENNERAGLLTVTFADSPFESRRKSFTAEPGKNTSQEELIEAKRDPVTRGNPVFPYTISIGAVSVDPDIIIDLSAARHRPIKTRRGN